MLNYVRVSLSHPVRHTTIHLLPGLPHFHMPTVLVSSGGLCTYNSPHSFSHVFNYFSVRVTAYCPLPVHCDNYGLIPSVL